jgi:hypothetical protein
MKVGKEEVVGALTALDLWLNGRDHVAEWKDFLARLEHVRLELEDVAGVSTRYNVPRSRANKAPRLMVSWEEDVVGKTSQEVHEELLAGDPRIFVRVSGPNLLIHSQMLEPGDEVHVARRLRAVLR